MLDTPGAPASPLHDLRRKVLAKPATLPVIFQTGDRILVATADPAAGPAAIPADLASQRVAVLSSVTVDYLSRAVACAILAAGIAPIVYRAPFGTHIQEILDPAAPLHSFAGLNADRAPAGHDAAHRQLADELPRVLPLGRAVHPAPADRAGATARRHPAGRRTRWPRVAILEPFVTGTVSPRGLGVPDCSGNRTDLESARYSV